MLAVSIILLKRQSPKNIDRFLLTVHLTESISAPFKEIVSRRMFKDFYCLYTWLSQYLHILKKHSPKNIDRFVLTVLYTWLSQYLHLLNRQSPKNIDGFLLTVHFTKSIFSPFKSQNKRIFTNPCTVKFFSILIEIRSY